MRVSGPSSMAAVHRQLSTQQETMTQRLSESPQSVVQSDSRQQAIATSGRFSHQKMDSTVHALDGSSTPDEQRQSSNVLSDLENTREHIVNVDFSLGGMRISKGDLSNAGTSNAIASDSSSANTDSGASQKLLQGQQQYLRQAGASHLAQANQGSQNILNLIA